MSHRRIMAGAVLAGLFLTSPALRAQREAPPVRCPAECPADLFDQPLREPREIRAAGGLLDTTLEVKQIRSCVPLWIAKADGSFTCTMHEMKLAAFGSPNGTGFDFGYPGPTYRLRKAERPDGAGDRLRVKLVNLLPPEPPAAANGCVACDMELCNEANKNPPGCCLSADLFPDCFHGASSTNLHFHGTHVSPQAAQDYVLLELLPAGTALSAAPHAHGRGTVAVGAFQYDLDPLRWTQPEGTHWYHPHKHGAVAEQVGNGMAGAMLIEGPFDDWLRRQYAKKGGLPEKLLVVQQVHELNFTGVPQIGTLQPLVDGQPSPKLAMCPGQVQRWRFVGATVEGGAQLTLRFSDAGEAALKAASPADCPADRLCARQIAMDGVRFSPAAYRQQPLLQQGFQQFDLSPGNRADFLVRAPAKPGLYRVTYDVFGNLENSDRRKQVRELLGAVRKVEKMAQSANDLRLGVAPAGRLLTVEVADGPGCPQGPVAFPAELPPMPSYLRDVEEIAGTRDLWFQLLKPGGQPADAGIGKMPSKFYIGLAKGEKRQFDPGCVDITTVLGTGEEWTVHNTTQTAPTAAPDPRVPPFHVFHIHTNPFQVVATRGAVIQPDGSLGCATRKLDPPVWQDSITLPSACADGSDGWVKIRQRFEEFTGEYVLHCHFLGHEDRGMMLAVQAVCPARPGEPESYGLARSRGDECAPGNLVPAAPRCPFPNPAPDALFAPDGHVH